MQLALCLLVGLGTGELTASQLDSSLLAGRSFLVNNQLAAGNFQYDVHLQTGMPSGEDGQVRQAGTLWGLALLHAERPSESSRQALRKGIDFFARHCRPTADGQGEFVLYPQAPQASTGTTALFSLALGEWLRAEPKLATAADKQRLPRLVHAMRNWRRYDGRFYQHADPQSGQGWDLPSPYFDGEILLALIKAARYQQADIPPAELIQSAESMYRAYVEGRLQEDSDLTKGFFQWGVMSFYELSQTDWDATTDFGERSVLLGVWMIEQHRVLERRANTGYAVEGLIHSWKIAKERNLPTADQFELAIRQLLAKLMTWQVGAPDQVEYLQQKEPHAANARGGVLNAVGLPWLRIDTTQHQMHACLCVRRWLFSP